jgi:hypothetical protein
MPYDTSLHDKRIGRMRADLSEGRRPESESKAKLCEQARVEDPSRRAKRSFANKRGSKTRVGEQSEALRTSEGCKPDMESKAKLCERGRFLSLMYAQYKISDVSQFIAVESTPGNSDIHRSYPVIVSSQFGK